MWRAVVLVAAGLALAGRSASADPRLLDDDTFAAHSDGDLALDTALFVGSPSALPSGITSGVAAGITRGCGCAFAYGARISWSEESAESQQWQVTHQELRLRAAGALRHHAGRGTISLRLSAGATGIYEDRVRQQGMRAGLTGDALEQRAFGLLPAAELEVVFAVHVAGPWLGVVSAGPSAVIDDTRALHGGFVAQIGVAWQP